MCCQKTVHSLWLDVVKYDYVLWVVTDFTPNLESIIISNDDDDDDLDKDKVFWEVLIPYFPFIAY
jgi:hypothetical protein